MPLKILELGKQFRPSTSIVYPPFKNGRYMEEYVYDYILKRKDEINTELVYIPAFWTNIQTHPNFQTMKQNYNILLKRAYNTLPNTTQYFTIVQHDLGVELILPENTTVFGACSGNICLPLIYEDTINQLLNIGEKRRETQETKENQKKEEFKYLASFVGTHTTHPLRINMFKELSTHPDIKFISKDEWSNNVSKDQTNKFIEATCQSKFCLAPRGYGRSSFRFFEAILLNTIPVYFWDDNEWLPYKEILDYSKFAISIQEKDIKDTVNILKAISDNKYKEMKDELEKVRHWFTLEGMCEYIVQWL